MLTAALARFHTNRGKRVKVFKVGPDYLDPMILEIASRERVDHLDLWMVGVERCRAQLFDAAAQFDLILIEGVMGLFDGHPSTADLAKLFNLPVAAVIDASGMAETIAAVAAGLAQFWPSLNFWGIIANKVASDKHNTIIETSMLASSSNFLGSIRRNDSFVLPRRHLGLVQAAELDSLELQLDAASQAIAETKLSNMPPLTPFTPGSTGPIEPLLQGKKIAVAKDKAFSFIYQANLNLIEEMGATLSFFSPLEDQAFDKSDSIYLPGGYPELFLEQLSRNSRPIRALKHHVACGGKIYAECGGMLYLLDTLTDLNGQKFALAGLISSDAKMNKRLSALGHQYWETEQGEIRGHTFHYSELTTPLKATARAQAKFDEKAGEAIYQHGNITASYVHFYFPSNPKVAAALMHGRL